MNDVTLDELYALYFSDLTDLQKHEKWETTYRSQHVVGEGTVVSIRAPEYSFIKVVVRPLSRKFLRELPYLTLSFPVEEKEKLLSVKKEQQIKYSGKLDDFRSFPFSLNNCKLL